MAMKCFFLAKNKEKKSFSHPLKTQRRNSELEILPVFTMTKDGYVCSSYFEETFCFRLSNTFVEKNERDEE